MDRKNLQVGEVYVLKQIPFRWVSSKNGGHSVAIPPIPISYVIMPFASPGGVGEHSMLQMEEPDHLGPYDPVSIQNIMPQIVRSGRPEEVAGFRHWSENTFIVKAEEDAMVFLGFSSDELYGKFLLFKAQKVIKFRLEDYVRNSSWTGTVWNSKGKTVLNLLRHVKNISNP